MDLGAVRAGIAEAVSAVTPSLNAYPYVPDSVSVPCFYVGGVQVEYDQTMGRGSDSITLVAKVLISNTSDESGQAALDEYLKGSGPASLKAAIELDESLGGVCHTTTVVRAQNYGFHTVGQTEYLGAELVIEVEGDGS